MLVVQTKKGGSHTPYKRVGTLAVALFIAVQALPIQGMAEALPSPLTLPNTLLTPSPMWTDVLDQAGIITGLEGVTAMSPDGSHVFTARSTGTSDAGSSRLVIYSVASATGAPTWTTTFQFGTQANSPQDIVVSPDGSRVFVAGNVDGFPCTCVRPFDVIVIALDSATGMVLWNATYDGPLHSADYVSQFGRSLAIDPTGSRLFVSATSAAPSEPGHNYHGFVNLDWVTLAYDAATGQNLWSARYEEGSYELARAFAISPDGTRVYVAGVHGIPLQSVGSALGLLCTGCWEFVPRIAAYNAATGAQEWIRSYDDMQVSGSNGGWGLAAAGDKVVWAATGGEHAASVINTAYVTGALVATTGAEVWRDQPALGGPFPASVRAMALSSDGSRAFVTGWSDPDALHPGGDKMDMQTVALDTSTGAPLWVNRFGGMSADSPAAIAVNPDGRHVYVSGTYYEGVASPTGEAYGSLNRVTISYDGITGLPAWVGRYAGGVADIASSRGLAVSPDGSRVFSAGVGIDSSYHPALVILAYQG